MVLVVIFGYRILQQSCQILDLQRWDQKDPTHMSQQGLWVLMAMLHQNMSPQVEFLDIIFLNVFKYDHHIKNISKYLQILLDEIDFFK